MPQSTDIDLKERGLALRFIRGKGIEIGAAHRPVWVNPAYCSVIYLDRLSARQFKKRFPELAAEEIVTPDIVCDVAVTGLSFIADAKLDFILASHLLEHLPNPLGFLIECHRVLRESGVLLLIVPDKNFTFDRDRQITPITHIVEDLRSNTTAVDEDHLVDYIVHAAKETIPESSRQRRKLFQRELSRSIHVHVWSSNELLELLEYVVGQEATSWELCELFLPKGLKEESIVVLRKTSTQSEAALAHFRQNAHSLVAREALVQSFFQDEEPATEEAAEPATTEELAPPPEPIPSKPRAELFPRRAWQMLGSLLRRSEQPAAVVQKSAGEHPHDP